MNTKTAYQTNAQGLYVGLVEISASSIEQGAFLLKAGASQCRRRRTLRRSK